LTRTTRLTRREKRKERKTDQRGRREGEKRGHSCVGRGEKVVDQRGEERRG